MPVAAATIDVNSSADTTGRTCTLRDAITAANTNAVKGGCAAGSSAVADTITFAPSLSGQTITLTSALPSLTGNLTIDGTSLASHVQISGYNAVKVFFITWAGIVTLTHLDIIKGKGALGGGIFNTGTLTVNNSTFWGNSASEVGGGIANAGILTVNNSTFSGNSASSLYGGSIYSGHLSDLYVGTLTVTVNNSTFSGNSAYSGGGIYSDDESTLTVNNSILANNGYDDCIHSGTFTGNNNLIMANYGCGTPTLTADPKLAPLGNYGGSSKTLALLADSPAIDKGNSATCLTTDQRGFARVGTCDIGAFESSVVVPTYAFNTVRNSTSTGTGSIAAITTVNGNYAAGTAITLATKGLSMGETVTWSPATCVAPTFNMPTTPLTCTATFTAALPQAFSTVRNPTSKGTGSIAATTTANGNYMVGTVITLATTGLGAGEIVNWSPATCVAPTFKIPASVLTCTALFIAPGTVGYIIVNSNADTTGTAGICTLRDAITAANTNAVKGGCTAGSSAVADSITFAPHLSGQTITLTSALPSLTSNLTIDGTSLASHVQISGNNIYQVFYISSGTVILTHLDITKGKASFGGGIYNSGGSTLTVNNSTLSGNSATSEGGGIYNKSSGTLTVNNSQVQAGGVVSRVLTPCSRVMAP